MLQWHCLLIIVVCSTAIISLLMWLCLLKDVVCSAAIVFYALVALSAE